MISSYFYIDLCPLENITFVLYMDRDVSIAGEGQRNLDYTRCYWHLRRAGALVLAVLLEVLSQFSDHLPLTKEIRR